MAASVICETNKGNVWCEISKKQVWMNYKIRLGYSAVTCACCENTKLI